MAPEKGSPFRPLYDDKIMFSGLPVALVLADPYSFGSHTSPEALDQLWMVLLRNARRQLDEQGIASMPVAERAGALTRPPAVS
jgi:hypothetical protein